MKIQYDVPENGKKIPRRDLIPGRIYVSQGALYRMRSLTNVFLLLSTDSGTLISLENGREWSPSVDGDDTGFFYEVQYDFIVKGLKV